MGYGGEMTKKPICDTCGGEEFTEKCTDVFPEPRGVNAREYYGSCGVIEGVPAIMIFHHYVATCKGCGAEYKYTM